MKTNWDNRLRDGFFYSIGSGLIVLLINYEEAASLTFIVIGAGYLALLGAWWFFTVQAVKRFFPGFFDHFEGFEYEQHKRKKSERKQASRD